VDVSEVVFVDCETTGLDPDRHEIWEVALIYAETERSWFLPVDLRRADPNALRVGRYYDRHPNGSDDPAAAAYQIARFLDGNHLVGAVPSFDAVFLQRFLNRHGEAATWHYHLIDVEALAVGWLYGHGDPMTGILPWSSDLVSRGVGVDPDDFDRHTALGDARWAKAIYEAVTK
jgi:DNA polymerase III epsilon subunit-like protein